MTWRPLLQFHNDIAANVGNMWTSRRTPRWIFTHALYSWGESTCKVKPVSCNCNVSIWNICILIDPYNYLWCTQSKMKTDTFKRPHLKQLDKISLMYNLFIWKHSSWYLNVALILQPQSFNMLERKNKKGGETGHVHTFPHYLHKIIGLFRANDQRYWTFYALNKQCFHLEQTKYCDVH